MGRTYGLLEAGYDHIGVMKAQSDFLRYFSIISNIPSLDRLFKKNPVILWLGRKGCGTV